MCGPSCFCYLEWILLCVRFASMKFSVSQSDIESPCDLNTRAYFNGSNMNLYNFEASSICARALIQLLTLIMNIRSWIYHTRTTTTIIAKKKVKQKKKSNNQNDWRIRSHLFSSVLNMYTYILFCSRLSHLLPRSIIIGDTQAPREGKKRKHR